MRKTWKSLTALALSAAMIFSNGALVVNAEEVQPEKAVSDIEQPEKVEAGIPEENAQKTEDTKAEKQDEILSEEQGVSEETAQESGKQENKNEITVKKTLLRGAGTTEEGGETKDTTQYYLHYDHENESESMLFNDSVVFDTFFVLNGKGEVIDDYQLEIVGEPESDISTVNASINSDGRSITVTSGADEGYIVFYVQARIGDQRTDRKEISISISDTYYTLNASQVNNINVGEILDLNTINWSLTKSYKDANGQKIEDTVNMETEGITLVIDPPTVEDTWKIESDSIEGKLPSIIRSSPDHMYISVNACDKDKKTLAYKLIDFEPISYDIELGYSYGSGIIYTDKALTLNVCETKDSDMPLPEGCTYDWNVDDSQLSEDKGASVMSKRSEDGKSLEITGLLNETDEDTYNVPVTLSVKKNDEALVNITNYLYMKNPRFVPYDFLDDTETVGVEYVVSVLSGKLENAMYPGGQETSVNVTKVVSSDDGIVSVSQRENEWIISTKALGTATITCMTDAPTVLGQTIKKTIVVAGDKCDISLWTDDDYTVLPGETIDICADGYWQEYANGEVKDKDIDTLRYEWKLGAFQYQYNEETEEDEVVPIDIEKVVEYHADTNNPRLLHVTVLKDAVESYIEINVKAYENETLKAENSEEFYVSSETYRISAEDIYAHPGDIIPAKNIKAVLKQYTPSTLDGTIINDAKITVSYVEDIDALSWDEKNGTIIVDKNITGGDDGVYNARVGLETTMMLDENDEKEIYGFGFVNINIHTPRWSAWKTSRPASTSAPEQQTRTCSVCKKSETRTVGSKLTPYLNLTANSLKMKVKQKTTAFKVTGMAKGDYVKSVVSSNKNVLKVSGVKSNGTFKLSAQKKKGTAKLTITTAYGAKKTIKVTVQTKAVKTTKISGLSKKVTLKKGKSVKLKPVIAPVTSQDKITYKTSNKKVATVSNKGVVKGKKPGKAKITVKSGSKKYTVTVVVTK